MASIVLQSVSVEFPIYDASRRSMKMHLLRFGGTSRVSTGSRGRLTVRALRDISIELRDGDRVGLIGRNGAGKSTLLRVLTGIYEPPTGRIAIDGRLASLLDFHLGMDADATGYENILLRGQFLGMSQREIEARVPEIEEFSELGEHLALPLRTYSSGMGLRLAFAVSTCVEPEILLLDEVISAADARFLAKAKSRLRQLSERARILVVASHVSSDVLDLCNKALLLKEGSVERFGPAAEVVEHYKSMQ